jgi:hypothetical protein
MMKKKKKQLSVVEQKKDKNHPHHHDEKPSKPFRQDTSPAKNDNPSPNQEHPWVEKAPTSSVSTTTSTTTSSTTPNEDPWSPANVQACATLWNLTDDQVSKLRQLHTLLCDNNNKNHKKDSKKMIKKNENVDDDDDVDSIAHHWKNDPFEVVRFCKDFHFDVDLVHSKFCKMIAWRQEHQVDSILQDYSPPTMFRYFPFGVLADLDHDGDPIYIERTGMADTLGLLKRYGKEEMIQQAIWVRELMTRGPWLEQEEDERQPQQQQPSLSSSSPTTASQPRKRRKFKYFTVILDMKGLNRHHLHPSLIPVGQHVTRLVQDNYAGLGKVNYTPIGTLVKRTQQPPIPHAY